MLIQNAQNKILARPHPNSVNNSRPCMADTCSGCCIMYPLLAEHRATASPAAARSRSCIPRCRIQWTPRGHGSAVFAPLCYDSRWAEVRIGHVVPKGIELASVALTCGQLWRCPAHLGIRIATDCKIQWELPGRQVTVRRTRVAFANVKVRTCRASDEKMTVERVSAHCLWPSMHFPSSHSRGPASSHEVQYCAHAGISLKQTCKMPACNMTARRRENPQVRMSFFAIIVSKDPPDTSQAHEILTSRKLTCSQSLVILFSLKTCNEGQWWRLA